MKHKKILGTIGAIVVVCMLSGCTYQFIGVSDAVPEHIRTVYIPSFENLTSEPNAGFIVGSEVKREFRTTGRLTPANKNEADGELIGRVTSLTYSNRIYDSNDHVFLVKVAMTADVKLVDIGGDVIWESEGMTVSEEYTNALGDEIMDVNRGPALEAVAKKMAREIQNRMLAGF